MLAAMSLTKIRRLLALAPALLLFSAAPASAHHDGAADDDDPAAGAAQSEPAETAAKPSDGASESRAGAAAAQGQAAAGAGVELNPDGMAINDANSFATSISAADVAPAMSLHSTAKIMNNSAVTNELKAALKANDMQGPTPEIAPPPRNHVDPAGAEGAPSAEPAAAVEDPPTEDIHIEVGSNAATDAGTAAAAGKRLEKSAKGQRSSLGAALIILALLTIGGGVLFARRNGAQTPAA